MPNISMYASRLARRRRSQPRGSRDDRRDAGVARQMGRADRRAPRCAKSGEYWVSFDAQICRTCLKELLADGSVWRCEQGDET